MWFCLWSSLYRFAHDFQAAEIKKKKEEREQRELEEYLKMKEAFEVEEEGEERGVDEQDSKNLLQEFVEFIKVRYATIY